MYAIKILKHVQLVREKFFIIRESIEHLKKIK